MSQDFFFHKQKIIQEEASQLVSRKEVHDAVKTFVAKLDLQTDTKLREKLFEEVKLEQLNISAYSKNIEPILDNETEFIQPNSRLFMVEDKMWRAIQKNIFYLCQPENNSKTELASDSNIDELLNDIFRQQSTSISNDYKILEELFRRKLLFVDIF